MLTVTGKQLSEAEGTLHARVETRVQAPSVTFSLCPCFAGSFDQKSVKAVVCGLSPWVTAYISGKKRN